jgi:hypothetical protein
MDEFDFSLLYIVILFFITVKTIGITYRFAVQ